jgi:hypothetical protein
MAERLGIDTTLKILRHYSATELITAGVDVRTVTGRLGHGGGGATTHRVYTACLGSRSRAAATITGRMPARPAVGGKESPVTPPHGTRPVEGACALSNSVCGVGLLTRRLRTRGLRRRTTPTPNEASPLTAESGAGHADRCGDSLW